VPLGGAHGWRPCDRQRWRPLLWRPSGPTLQAQCGAAAPLDSGFVDQAVNLRSCVREGCGLGRTLAGPFPSLQPAIGVGTATAGPAVGPKQAQRPASLLPPGQKGRVQSPLRSDAGQPGHRLRQLVPLRAGSTGPYQQAEGSCLASTADSPANRQGEVCQPAGPWRG